MFLKWGPLIFLEAFAEIPKNLCNFHFRSNNVKSNPQSNTNSPTAILQNIWFYIWLRLETKKIFKHRIPSPSAIQCHWTCHLQVRDGCPNSGVERSKPKPTHPSPKFLNSEPSYNSTTSLKSQGSEREPAQEGLTFCSALIYYVWHGFF